MFRRVKAYEIPLRFYVQVDGDGEPLELGTLGLPYPYNPQTAIPRLLRELADKLEEIRDDGTEGR